MNSMVSIPNGRVALAEPVFDMSEVETPAFPIEELGVLAAPAQAIVEHVQVPAGLAGMSLLTAAALVAQAHVDVEIDGRRFPCSLFGMSIAESGDRKSQTDVVAMRAHRQWEEWANGEWKRTVELEKLLCDIWESQVKRIKGRGGDPFLVQDELERLGPKPKLTPEPTLTVSSPTFEGLIQAYRTGISYKGLFSDEGGAFFGGYAMRQETMKATIAGLSSLWDGSPIRKTNAAEGQAFALWGRRLSAHLMLQPVIATEIMGDPLLTGQGFLPRFLITWPKSMKGERLYRGSDPTQDVRLTGYWELMRELLTRPVKAGEEGALELRTLKLDAEARRVWIDAYNEIETELGAHRELSEIAASGAKSAELAARVAAVLAFVENPASDEIHARHVCGGVAVVKHSLMTLQAIRNRARADAEMMEVEKLRVWLAERTAGRPHGVITKTEIAWYYRPKTSGRVLSERLNVLSAKGWLRVVAAGAEYEGKHVRQAWAFQS
jgi:hypothetical protein